MHDATPGNEVKRSAAQSPGRSGARRKNMALAALSVIATLLALEAGYRLVADVPLLSFANWRHERVQIFRLGERGIADPHLGWTVRAGFESDDHNTLEHGIRRNFGETAVRTGEILAVGDSFTEGWEVHDDETWPAHLERLTGRAVVNGGVGGYGTDQIVLRAEQLLPVVRPKVLIVGFLEFDIFRSAHSIFGAPKPHFTLEDGELKYHPPPPLEPKKQGGALSWIGDKIRVPLGYSGLLDHLLARLAPDYWYASERPSIRRVTNDGIAVTCALLARLKKRVDQDGVRMLLFMQHYAPNVIENDRPSENARKVMACARERAIQVVDQFDPLRAIAAGDPDKVWSYYVDKGHTYTHMTSKGNEHAAGVLAKALALEPAR